MQNTLKVTFEGDHVLVIADGDKDHSYMDTMWRTAIAACEANNCFRLLGIGNTTTPVEIVDGYDLPSLFRELNVDGRYRIAWVEQDEDARDVVDFIATVLANRGLPGRVFDTEAEAKDWLLSD